jgi:hypothetical protein
MLYRRPAYKPEELAALRQLLIAAGKWFVSWVSKNPTEEEIEAGLVPLKPDPREDFNLAINFAVDHAGIEAEHFLRSWREGDWACLRNSWPEWVAYCKERGIDA